MLGALFGFLLALSLMAFFGVDYYADLSQHDAIIRGTNIALSGPQLKIILGIAVVFFEFAFIASAMIEHIGETIKDIIKLMVKTIPLLAFLTSIYTTFGPIASSILPDYAVNSLYLPQANQAYLSDAIRTNVLQDGILLTLATMILFLVTSLALRPRENAELKKLRKEIQQLKKKR